MNTLEQAITKYNIPVPRYTSSLLPANLFFGTLYCYRLYSRCATEQPSRSGGYLLHSHTFRKGICHFCARNKQILPRQEGKVEEYIGYLLRELELLKPHIQPSRQVVQIHFGGGSPTSIPIKYISQIGAGTHCHFPARDESRGGHRSTPRLPH